MKHLLYIFIAVCLYSCSPKLSPGTGNNHIPPLTDTTFVLVLSPGDRYNGNGKIAVISSSDSSISPACTYDEIIARFKQVARAQGANLVKITSYKKPAYKGDCDKMTARLYRVDNVKAYEQKFDWSPDRKLSWDDFKGTPAPNRDTNVAARTSCRFGIRVDTMYASGIHVVVTNEFICQQSSVRPGRKTPALLAHEQLHFDLCEVYARILRKQLANTALTPANVNRVSTDAFLETYKVYKERQWAYDEETLHGLKPEAQAHWKESIEKELAALDGYKY
ncbi:DUF922 domain-containing protein [Chitinophaga filiformis]|uniref:DUF922 domain-containing protein n=1 Tax=Chitinophaga filiformis TaxID=104663 RepID=A0A1G7P905_CHIFI|nr:hypothetical protein [Chitinophaga filiformis]SDF82701.1 hypothetical protein SAMN04488121_1021108 [Chitinophaga filiformis]